IERFSHAYATAHYPTRNPAIVTRLDRLDQVLSHLTPPVTGYGYAELGVVKFGLGGTPFDQLEIRARITDDPCFGPDDITLEFGRTFHFAGQPEASFFKAGKATFRNSGTSPKAAGYHNLDVISFSSLYNRFGRGTRDGIPILHPYSRRELQDLLRTGESLTNQRIEALLTTLAIERAEFTNRWVRTHLRGE
ncbi:hypothetical protein JW905_11120, partial [bacterium]|nr:hypothetical protein [candidate division CSSED10-310 bacterium]